jgi:hypothetical protein
LLLLLCLLLLLLLFVVVFLVVVGSVVECTLPMFCGNQLQLNITVLVIKRHKNTNIFK